jgi:N-acetylglucosaminyldiphosphoundecaprenol N-acetyl-beta-D-mannosaminyltransferase
MEGYATELGVPFRMGVGGSFDVMAGRTTRAPRWAQRIGMEWAFRLLQEPRRMARRYLVGNTAFVLLTIRRRWMSR